MPISSFSALIIILICAACTLLERALPFLLFRGKAVPEIIRKLGAVLPLAVITTLVFYCLRDVSFETAASFLPQLTAALVTALLHRWKRKVLFSVVGGTALYMVLVQFVFA